MSDVRGRGGSQNGRILSTLIEKRGTHMEVALKDGGVRGKMRVGNYIYKRKFCEGERHMKAKPIEIQQETKYWLVRPGVNSLFFDEFYNDGCIAIGWDRIGKIDENGQVYSIDSLKNLVEEKYEDLLSKKDSLREYKRKISDIAFKIFRFTYDVKVGDIVITPGENSVLIGRVTSGVEIVTDRYIPETLSNEEQYIGQLNKMRKVEWIKKIDKSKLEPNIRLELRVIHGISCISNRQVITEINRTIYDYFTYNNEGHSVYTIKNEKAIDFEKYAKFIACINDIYLRTRTDKTQLYIKANINSPGPIELIGKMDIVEKITTIMYCVFKASDEQIPTENIEIVRELKQQYEGMNYDDYDFPCGGCV